MARPTQFGHRPTPEQFRSVDAFWFLDSFKPLWLVLQEVDDVLFVARASILRSANMQAFLEAHERAEAIRVGRAPEPLSDRELRLITVSQREVDQDFPLLNGYSLMMIWGAVEAWADDLAITALGRWSRHADRLTHRVRVTGQSLLEPDTSRRLQAYLDSYRREVGKAGGRARLEAALELVEMKPGLHTDVTGGVDASYTIRNLYAHNAGRADHSFVTNNAHLGLSIGDRVHVSTSDLQAYLGSISAFAIATRQVGLSRFGLFWDEAEGEYYSSWTEPPAPDLLPLG